MVMRPEIRASRIFGSYGTDPVVLVGSDPDPLPIASEGISLNLPVPAGQALGEQRREPLVVLRPEKQPVPVALELVVPHAETVPVLHRDPGLAVHHHPVLLKEGIPGEAEPEAVIRAVGVVAPEDVAAAEGRLEGD